MSLNASEARLADLSRRTFLSLWSYQNPFYKKGKELCDLLVVFGDDVVIFSDKVVAYSSDKPSVTAWKRWYRRAVSASIDQLRGALKTVRDFPLNVHLDPHVSSPFPISFPKPESARYHLVAIVHGSEEACTTKYGRPSLKLDSDLGDDTEELSVGVRFPEFVHIVSRTALDALFECFDTTADFINYLDEKEGLFNQPNVVVFGEENLIAIYMQLRRPDGRSKLQSQAGTLKGVSSGIDVGEWSRLVQSTDFSKRKSRLGPSYVIDEVIEQAASEYRDGRFLQGQKMGVGYHAAAFCLLAAEPRMARLLMGIAIEDVLHENPNTYWSVTVESSSQAGVLYVWLVYPTVPDDELDESLEASVADELEAYIFVAMGKFPSCHTFFGIALPNKRSRRTSRVFRMAKRDGWTQEMQDNSRELSIRRGILSHLETSRNVAFSAI